MLDDLLEELDRNESAVMTDGASRGLRLFSLEALARMVGDAAQDLGDATNDWERAMLRRLERASTAPAGWVSQEDRVVRLRHQLQWAKAAHLADLVCVLLAVGMGGGQVDPDTAGVALDERARKRVAWLANEGFAYQAGGRRRGASGT